ncbi:import receptor [Phlyctochytrium arcticum]|nr:import receptor [Phlyctochytrium arcticum]
MASIPSPNVSSVPPPIVVSPPVILAPTVPVEAAQKSIHPSWKVVAACAVAGVAVAAGAWYLLSSNAAEDKKKKPESPKLTSPKPKKKKKSSKKVASTAGAKESETPQSVTDETPAEKEPLPDNLFPEDIESLSKAARADLAKQAKVLGNKYYAEKGYDEALKLYSQAITLSPNDAVFYSNRAACYANLNNYDAVLEDCTAALKLDSTYVKALNRRAQAYEHTEDWTAALNDYTVMCVLEEFKNESVLGSTDRVLKSLAQNKAKELMSTKLQKLPSDTFIAAYMDSFHLTSSGSAVVLDHPVVEEGDELVKKSYQAVKDRNYNLADTEITAGIETGKLSPFFAPFAYNMRATFFFLRGNVDAAFEDLERSLELDPKNTNSIVKRASIFMERGELEKAIGEYDRAIGINPQDPDVYYHRGQVRSLTQDMVGAVEDYKKCMALDDTFVYAHIQMGVALYKMGELENANTTFEKASRKFKTSGEVFNYRGEIMLDTQNYEQAIINFDKAIALMPASPLPHINKAILHLQSKQDTAKAESECRKAIEVDPMCDMAYAQLAQLLLHQGKFEESLSAYDKAAELARTEAELTNAIALREAAAAQWYVAKNYPEVMARLRAAM